MNIMFAACAIYGTAGNAAPYLVEAANALPELLDEVEMLRKAFQQACDWIHQDSGCPADVFDWGCPHVGENECQENAVECWEQYFLEKARGEY